MGTLTVRVTAYVVGAAVSVWIARALGPHDRGVWSLCILIATILGLVIDGGLGTAGLYLLRRDPSQRSTVLRSALRIVVANACFWVCISLIVVAAGYAPVPDLTRLALAFAALASGFAATGSVVRQLLNGLGDLAGTNGTILIQMLALPAALVPALLIAEPTAEAALMAYVLSTAVTAAAASCRLIVTFRPRADWSRALVRPLTAYGLRSQMVTVIMVLAYRSDLLLVSHVLGVSAAGVYSVALALSEILRGVAETAQTLVVGHAVKADLGEFAHAMARRAMVVTAAVGIAMAVVSAIVVPWVFGVAYADAAEAFWYLAPGILGLTLSYSLSPLLFLQGRILVNGAAALVGVAALWLVGLLGPGQPTLVKIASASSVGYWAMACVQLIVLRARGDVRVRDLLPTPRDLRQLVEGMGSFTRAQRRAGDPTL